MTVWEKTLVNVQKGYDRLMVFAAVFAERTRAEINIIRIRMQIDGIQRDRAEQQQAIGRRLLELKEDGKLPRTAELFFQDHDVTDAVEKIDRLGRDLEILLDDLQMEADVLKGLPAKPGEGSA